MKCRLLLIFMLALVGCNNKEKKIEDTADRTIKTTTEIDVNLEVYDFAGFEKFLNKKDNKVHVINFWATWCAPCVKELPYFERLNKTYASTNIDVLLVSLDFPHLYDSKLKPFIKEKNIKSKVIALDDVDMNTWIPKVDENWTGSLPATLIYKNDVRKFFEKSLTYEELETEVKQFLK